VSALSTLPHGELAVGGNFTTANGAVSAYFARYASTCPAQAAPYGSGCTGSGGLGAYTALSLPWLGSTFRARGTGLPNVALVAMSLGFTTVNQSLATLLPQLPVGCSLLAAPDCVVLRTAVGGSLDTQFVLPANLAFAGLVLHQQLVALEFGLAGQLLGATATNGLTLTLGAF